MTNPNPQKKARGKLKLDVRLPPVPRSLSLDTPGLESRISIADIPDAMLESIAEQWVMEFLRTAREIREERIERERKRRR